MAYLHRPHSRLFVIALACLSVLAVVSPAAARVGDVSTWMGKLYIGDGKDANSATLDAPRGFDADSICSLYIADTANHVIRKIDGGTNVITTFAGTGQYGLTNGATRSATFKLPSDVALGPNDELFVTDSDSTVLRRIFGKQVITWLTGLKNPSGIAVDGTTVYVSDTGRNRILKGSTTAKTATIAAANIKSPGKLVVSGNYLYLVYNGGKSFGRVDLTTKTLSALKTDFFNADGLELHNGLLYIVSGLHGVLNEIVTYDPATGTFSTIKSVYETQWYNHASDITFCGSSMRLLFSGGSSVFTAAEDGSSEVKMAGVTRWNDLDGPRSTARVGRPWLMTMSPDKQTLYVFANQHLKKVNLKTNVLSAITGGQADNYVDGPAAIARVSGPSQMVTSPKGTAIYIADRNNNRIRVFDRKTNVMSTLVGAGEFNAFNGTKNAYAEGAPCSTASLGVAGCAYFDRPMGLAISKDGKTLYVADSDNNRIRTINVATGQTALLAGTGKAGLRDGAAKTAQFKRPVSLLLSSNGKTLYVVELGNHAIRTIDLVKKRVATMVGNGRAGYRDGSFKNARLSVPNYLAYGPKNILYLSEGGSLRIRQLNTATRKITTLTGGIKGSRNGSKSVASFSNPRQLVMLNSTTLLVADDGNDMIRAVSLK
ncbi:MAG: hypothetical protein AAB619_01570 [Patescibacteria group bacterium]